MKRRTRSTARLITVALTVMTAGLTVMAGQSATSQKQTFGAWGIDLTSLDKRVKPGDDFFTFANGNYLARTEIPPDQSSTGTGYDLFNLTQEQLRALIEASAARSTTPTAAQIGGLYKSFMDDATIETLDAKPIAQDLAAIQAVKSKAEFVTLMGKTATNVGASLFAIEVAPDAKKPVSTVYLGQSGIGMPDRDYYLADGFKEKKQAYEAYATRTFSMLGAPHPEATAKAVVDFETKLAEASWPAADRRDIDKVYNPMTVAALQTYAPSIGWRALLDASGLKAVDAVVVTENTAVQRIARVFEDAPLETLKAWETFHFVDGAAPYLSKRFVDSQFDFDGKALSGTPTQRPRWKRGVSLVDGRMGEAVGKEYVAKHFPPASKAQMEDLVANLKKAMAERIQLRCWMSADTKQQALVKLSKMTVMVGYPTKWRDYSGLTIDPADLYGNVTRSIGFETAYQFAKVGKPVDREEWAMTPQTVDAYNGGLENKIVFPAGILQAPIFNPSADPAVNYGAIGAIIGHEITHGFDDQGRKIDATGALHDWWTAEDAKRFVSESDKLAAQFDTYEGVPGMRINGRLTLGENIADLGGLLVAIDGYHASLGGKPAPVIDGLTGDQRLLLGYAQAWRGKTRDDALRAQMASDPHSPREFRVIGPTRNLDDWYSSFEVKPDAKYYLKSEERVRVW